MAKQIYKFVGKAAYVTRNSKVFNTNPVPVWTMAFYPETAAERKMVKDTGIKNRTQEDDGSKSGVEGFFYTFRSNTPYTIMDAEGNVMPEDILIGNGSLVEVALEVETFNSQRHGPQARSKLLSVQVMNLVPYVPKTEATVTDVTELPV